jgi:hypothetical protein
MSRGLVLALLAFVLCLSPYNLGFRSMAEARNVALCGLFKTPKYCDNATGGQGGASSTPTASSAGALLTRVKKVAATPAENMHYVDLAVNCTDGSVAAFASAFAQRAWSLKLLGEDREAVLTLVVENVGAGAASKLDEIGSFVVARVQKTNTAQAKVLACEDIVVANLPASSRLRIKFNLMQSRDKFINTELIAPFRVATKVLGFFLGGGLFATLDAAANEFQSNKTALENLANQFDDKRVESTTYLFGPDDQAQIFGIGQARLTLSRQTKRSVYLQFDDKGHVTNFQNVLAKEIKNGTGVVFDEYLAQQKASGWLDLISSPAPETARKGCDTLRQAVAGIFDAEEVAAILAKLIGGLSGETLDQLKVKCINANEVAALGLMKIPNPILDKTVPPIVGPQDPPPDPNGDVRFRAVSGFMDEFGLALARSAAPPVDARTLDAFFFERVATQSFDASDLMPTSDGAQRDKVADKVATWPFGGRVRFGCYRRPDSMLKDKYAGQMLIELDAGGAKPVLLNAILGFSDLKTTEVNRLVISHLMIERAGSTTVEAARVASPEGCGPRGARWKPWEKPVS